VATRVLRHLHKLPSGVPRCLIVLVPDYECDERDIDVQLRSPRLTQQRPALLASHLVHEPTQSGFHLGIFAPERLSYRLSADLVVPSAIMQPRLMSSTFPVT
jgi:hypothetical protein